jgi:hypothetical protein
MLGAQDVDFALTESLESFQSAVALWTVSCEIGVERGDALQERFEASQRSPETVEKLAEPKSKSLRHSTSMHHKLTEVKIWLLMLWHASLARSRQQARSSKQLWESSDYHWRAND